MKMAKLQNEWQNILFQKHIGKQKNKEFSPYFLMIARRGQIEKMKYFIFNLIDLISFL